jgi:hypothetical protein
MDQFWSIDINENAPAGDLPTGAMAIRFIHSQE